MLFWERKDSTLAYFCVYEYSFTGKRFFWVWHRPARPSTHNTWNGGNNNNGGVNNNQNTGYGNGGSNSWTGGNGNNGPVSNNQQGDVASPGKFTDSKAT